MRLAFIGLLVLVACGSKKEECQRVIDKIHDATMVEDDCRMSGPRTADEADVAAQKLTRAATAYESKAMALDELDVKTAAVAKARDDASVAARAAERAAKSHATLARTFKPDGLTQAWTDTNDCKRAQDALNDALQEAAATCK